MPSYVPFPIPSSSPEFSPITQYLFDELRRVSEALNTLESTGGGGTDEIEEDIIVVLSDSIFIQSATLPDTPVGDDTSETSLPSGWVRDATLNPTTTLNVYRSQRRITRTNGEFTSATAFGTPVIVKAATGVVVRTTMTDIIYGQFATTPTAPIGGTDNETHLPSGWSRTDPGATEQFAVYQAERTLNYDDGVFVDATAWGDVVLHEAKKEPPPPPMPVITTDRDNVYILGSSQPTTPTGGTNAESHVPTNWTRNRNSLTPTTTEGIWRSQRTRTYSNSVFSSASAWETPTRIVAPVTVTTVSATLTLPASSLLTSKPFLARWTGLRNLVAVPANLVDGTSPIAIRELAVQQTLLSSLISRSGYYVQLTMLGPFIDSIETSGSITLTLDNTAKTSVTVNFSDATWNSANSLYIFDDGGEAVVNFFNAIPTGNTACTLTVNSGSS